MLQVAGRVFSLNFDPTNARPTLPSASNNEWKAMNQVMVKIKKRNGVSEQFNRQKLERSLMKAEVSEKNDWQATEIIARNVTKDPKTCQIKEQANELSKVKQDTEKKTEDYLDKLRRLQVDMDNLQKITMRQV